MFSFFSFETEHKEAKQLLKDMAKQTMKNLTFEVLVSFTQASPYSVFDEKKLIISKT